MFFKMNGTFIGLILLTIFISACEISNERLAQKMLKKEGIWNIENIAWNKVQNGFNYSIDTGSISNAGFLHFYKNGNIQYQYSLSQNTRTGLAMWETKEKNLIVNYIDLPDVPMQLFPVEYEVQHQGRHEIKLIATESFVDDLSQSITNTITIELKRRK